MVKAGLKEMEWAEEIFNKISQKLETTMFDYHPLNTLFLLPRHIIKTNKITINEMAGRIYKWWDHQYIF